MTDLVAFLRARLDEDERVARLVTRDGWGLDQDEDGGYYAWQDLPEDAFGHARRWSPERVLAEVAAKRALIEAIEGMEGTLDWEFGASERGEAASALVYLAQPYADHPDYRQEWTP